MSHAHRRDHDHRTGTTPDIGGRAGSGITEAHGRSQVGRRATASVAMKARNGRSARFPESLAALPLTELSKPGGAVVAELKRRAVLRGVA